MELSDIDRTLEKMESQASDELALLADTGPEFFSTPQLIRLYGQWEIKHLVFRKVQRLLVRTLAWSPAWLLLWIGFTVMGWTAAGIFCLVMFPLFFSFYFGCLLFQRRFFKGNAHKDFVGIAIREELEKRKKSNKA